VTTQTRATAEIEKWLRIPVRIFTKFWLRIRVLKKNAESCRSRLRHSGSMATSDTQRWNLQQGSTKVKAFNWAACRPWVGHSCSSQTFSHFFAKIPRFSFNVHLLISAI